MKPSRLDVLPSPQRRLWPELAAVRDDGLVLYGGTAVALFLGHRASVDFDFFTHLRFQPDDVLKRFHFLRGAEILESRPDTLTVLVQGGESKRETTRTSTRCSRADWIWQPAAVKARTLGGS